MWMLVDEVLSSGRSFRGMADLKAAAL